MEICGHVGEATILQGLMFFTTVRQNRFDEANHNP